MNIVEYADVSEIDLGVDLEHYNSRESAVASLKRISEIPPKTYAKSNGYRIYKATINSESDCARERGLRIFTATNPHFKGIDRVSVFTYCVNPSVNSEAPPTIFKPDPSMYNLYMGNGYINITLTDDLDEYIETGEYHIIILVDKIYISRNNAFEKLLFLSNI